MSFSELRVTIKDAEKKLHKDFAIYEVYTVDENDPVIQQCRKETLENFNGEPDSVKVTITMEL